MRLATSRMVTETDMKYSQPLLTKTWENHLHIARQAAKEAGNAIRDQFGSRVITTYKGSYDVQLEADLIAQEIILSHLNRRSPEYGVIAEEGAYNRWPDNELTWAVDPLDGSNNFGYGIAHCAIAISLFHGDSVVLALVLDPLTGREFFATETRSMATQAISAVPLKHATVSLVTSYSQEDHVWGSHFSDWLGAQCKRVTTLWAPALDLALVANGSLDAMVCHEADLLDVCSGVFLVESAGGHIVGLDGRPVKIRRSMHQLPVSFIAARGMLLARELVDNVCRFQGRTGRL